MDNSWSLWNCLKNLIFSTASFFSLLKSYVAMVYINNLIYISQGPVQGTSISGCSQYTSQKNPDIFGVFFRFTYLGDGWWEEQEFLKVYFDEFECFEENIFLFVCFVKKLKITQSA